MVFVVSKIVGALLSPTALLLGVLLIALRAGRRWLVLAVVLLGVGDFTTLGAIALNHLENQVPPATAWQDGSGPEGFIILGGAIDQRQSNTGRGEISLNGAAERLTEALALARRYPNARVVFSGFSDRLSPTGDSEGQLFARFAPALGLDPARMIIEDKARNTDENAVFTAALVRQHDPARWVLITSAAHMPRAIAAFEAVGWVPQPWPVDYRTPPEQALTLSRGQLAAWSTVFHEWAGLLTHSLREALP